MHQTFFLPIRAFVKIRYDKTSQNKCKMQQKINFIKTIPVLALEVPKDSRQPIWMASFDQ